MKLMIINGTPKTEGICYSLVQTAEKTALSCGADVDIVRLADLDLIGCKMCGDGWGICYSVIKRMG